MRSAVITVVAVLVGFSLSFGLGTLVLRDQLNDTPKPAPTVTQTVSPTPTESPVEKEDSAAKYGETIQLSEGLQVTVLAPKVYPKDPAVKMSKKYYKLFTVTVKNTTKTTIPRTEEWYVESGDGEFTVTEGNGMPEGPLASGGNLTFTVVFGYDTAETPTFTFMTTPMWEISKPYKWA